MPVSPDGTVTRCCRSRPDERRGGDKMPKGYWIVRVDVTNPLAWDRYRQANGAVFARFGARFLVRGGTFSAREGQARERNIVLEFPSYEQAMACYESPEYAPVLAMREGAGVVDLIIIEGYEGPQPT
jgi:uncharacterized protein (DUF1330 family)